MNPPVWFAGGRARSHYGRVTDPAPYTHGHHESVLRSHRWRTAANSAGFLLPYLEPGTTILDVGCGPGTITIDLARLVAPGRVVGIDPAAEVIDAARAEPEASLVEFRTGSVFALEEFGRFDVVYAHQVLQHLQDPVGALRAMQTAARPGGIIAARDADYGAMTWYPAEPGLDEWLELYRTVARANGTEPDAGRRLLAWAVDAGFEDVNATADVWCFANEADRQWWGNLWADRMQYSTVASRALDLGLATQNDLDRISEAWRRWTLAKNGWFVVINGEILCRNSA